MHVWPYRKLYHLVFRQDERFDPRDRTTELEYATWVADKSTGRVLDLGCGYGYGTAVIAQRPGVSDIIAIDKIPAKKFRFHNEKKIRFISHDINALPHDLGLFDTITSTEFVEHITEVEFAALAKWIHGSLAPRGMFIGSTPHNTTDKKRYTWNPHHKREYQPEVLKHLLMTAGFAAVKIEFSRSNDTMYWTATIN